MLSDSELVVGADTVVVTPDRIVSPGRLTLHDGKVTEAAQRRDGCDVFFDGCAILPGLINAHTHLEFSDLASPLPAGATFPEWIGKVVAHRRQQESAGDGVYRKKRRDAFGKGASELYNTGTAFAADIVTEPWTASDYGHDIPRMLDNADSEIQDRIAVESSSGLDAKLRHLPSANATMLAMPEVIGLDEQRIAATTAWARHCVEDEPGEQLHSLGLSPHSPYSVLIDRAAEAVQATRPSTLLAMHLAESLEELEWLENRSGPFRAAFERIGVEAPSSLPSIDQCIEMLATRRSLLVHGNYLTEAQMRNVAQSEAMSVVYCPRTHAFFGHSPYPLKGMMQLGARVVLGTDSRASNPDLDLWKELRLVRQQHPWITAKQVLAMATIHAAEALGISGQFGALDIGYAAHAFVTPLLPGESSDRLIQRITTGVEERPSLAAVSHLLCSRA
ncbi:MAG: amidohydrolase family protein [Aureliella sp.]